MDFQTLTRRELQALCKKNKIPANLTNVAMADSLKALDIVDGIEEFLNNRSEFESEQSIVDTPIAPRTSCRSSARKVPINDDAVNSQILTRTRRGAKTVVAGEDNENGKLDVPETPAGQSCRRRAPIAPVRPKMETQLEIEMEAEKKEQLIQAEEEKKGVPETPVATTAHRLRATRSSARVVSVNQKVEASMSNVRSTRRTTTRNTENSVMELSLDGDDEIEPANLDDDEKKDIPSKVETPVVPSEGIAEIITQDSEPSSQTMDVESEVTEETKDDVIETEIDEVSGQTLNAEAEMDEDVEILSENSIEKLQESSEPSSQTMNVQSEETKDYVMKTENDEVSGQTLNAEAEMDEDEDVLKTNEGMGVSIAHLGDQFDKSLNLGDEIIEKKEVAVKDYSVCSLRQLKKQVKQIAANKGKKNDASEEEEVVNARAALQNLSENSMVVDKN
ncbi:uncharacterized protein LOC124933046 isoform X2 [Impatiens glandulifera]|uniref:uncharacterized protein LOC124933046 isoform X2 n=1 Tax=Impatiens glandulifera TaxID=253017 RepID=UPI001FB18161|nr:uncharacterized protein LOC124933046 isoform X2 [Impatiens glandulifera]